MDCCTLRIKKNATYLQIHLTYIMQAQTALKMMLWLIAVLTIFHLCILLKLIPYEITWGGRLENDAAMYRFETASILINLFLGWMLLIRGKYVRPVIPPKGVNIILWLFFGLFALNSVGNLLAATLLEKSFTLLTLLFCLLLWIILKKGKGAESMKKSY